MNKHFFLFSTYSALLAIVLVSTNTHAADATLDEIKSYKDMSDSGTLVFSVSFEEKDIAQQNIFTKNEFKLVPGAGRNGTTAMQFITPDPNKYVIAGIRLPALDSNFTYVLKMFAKAENLVHPSGVTQDGLFCWEYANENGAFVYGKYPVFENSPNEWKEYELMFKPSPRVKDSQITFYLKKGMTGKVTYDDIALYKYGKKYAAVLSYPKNLTSRIGKETFVFQFDVSSPKSAVGLVTLKNGGRTFEKIVVPDAAMRAKVDFDGIVEGPVEISISIADTSKKIIIGKNTYNLKALVRGKAPANAAMIDENGVLHVNGKPFFVNALFVNHAHKNALADIEAAGFNAIVPYASMKPHSYLLDKEELSNFTDEIKLFMEKARKHNLKVIFNLKGQLAHANEHEVITNWDGVTDRMAVALKAVNLIKDHPQLLGWYINDETSAMYLQDVIDMREQVSKTDLWHPIVSLTYEIENLPNYANSGDVFSYDSYPIDHDKKTQSLRGMLPGLEASRDCGVPHWFTQQVFNWAIYKAKNNEEFRESYFPTEKELRSMPLLAAINGAKGFIGYQYDCVVPYVDQRWPGRSKEEWPKVVAMSHVLNDLGPFIIGPAGAPEVTVDCTVKDEVQARAFIDGKGGIRVVIVGMGKKCDAKVTVPGYPNLTSQFGMTRNLGDGVYLFHADVIDSDILK